MEQLNELEPKIKGKEHMYDITWSTELDSPWGGLWNGPSQERWVLGWKQSSKNQIELMQESRK